jgi:hypothetical protein
MRELLGKVLHENLDQLVRMRLTEHKPVSRRELAGRPPSAVGRG